MVDTDAHDGSLVDPQELGMHRRKGTQNFDPSEEDEHSENGDAQDEGEDRKGKRESRRRRPSGSDGRRRSNSTNNQRRRPSYTGMPGEASSRLLIPSARVGFVIGRGGDVIKSICETTGTHIAISPAGEYDRSESVRLAVVTGSVTAVCWAVELISNKAGLFDGHSGIPASYGRRTSTDDDDEKSNTSPPGLKLSIGSHVAGSLIGKGGTTINEIRNQARARVLVLDNEESEAEGATEDERVVIIVGGPEACRRAHQLVAAALLAAEMAGNGRNSTAGAGELADPTLHRILSADGEKSFGLGKLSINGTIPGTEENTDEPACEILIRIPADIIGKMIGKEGSNINRIRKESGCRVTVGNSRPGEARTAPRLIRIQGSLKHTAIAQQLISDQLEATE